MITYVVPTLNSATTLEMTLLSLHSQKGVKINIIVVDSGSSDETLKICQHWNIKTLYAEPGNMYRAINVGLRECKTQWLGYINSDDWLYTDSVARLVAQGNAKNADFVYGNCDFTDASGRFMYSFAPPRPRQLQSLYRTGVLGFAQQASIFRNSLFQQLDGFNEEYSFCSDKEFYVRAINTGASFSFLPGAPVACFRLHANQLSQTKSNWMNTENQQIQHDLVPPANSFDYIVKMQWLLGNIPHYLLRFLRQSLLLGKPVITKSMHSGLHNSVLRET